MGELAASLAHELNQPLTGILANAQAARRLLAADPRARPELRQILQDIVDDDKRAAEVISRMREMVSKRAPERTIVDVNEVVQTVTKLLASDSIIRQVSIQLELAQDSLIVDADPVQLEQVFLNLLLNALEATSISSRLPHTVLVATEADDHHSVHVIVRDNGAGLPAGAEWEVFEPFYTTKGSGMGMGLSIARSIIESHGGNIWAATAIERGAEFHFTLPRTASAAATRIA
jgi:C4-dicarboxylate-specific signal transduction histidine kinase